MIDYISGNELSDEETITYYVLLADNDPTPLKRQSKKQNGKGPCHKKLKL
jgi:hypothetical protein